MWLGAALTLAGLLFAVWARLYLGKNWSGMVTVKHDHELIRSGPYRFVRHPIYSGILAGARGYSHLPSQCLGLPRGRDWSGWDCG